MTTERAQDPSVICIFLRKVFFRLFGIFAKLFLGLEHLDLPVVASEKVNEVDVLIEDSLRINRKTIKSGDQRARTGGNSQRGILCVCLESGRSAKHDRVCASCWCSSRRSHIGRRIPS